MKKILTLALAAVMGLGLVVLPQAETSDSGTQTQDEAKTKTVVYISFKYDGKEVGVQTFTIEKDTLLADVISEPAGYVYEGKNLTLENKGNGISLTLDVLPTNHKSTTAAKVEENVAVKFVDQNGKFIYAETIKLEEGKYFALTVASKLFEAAQKADKKLLAYEVTGTDMKDDILVVKKNQPVVVTATVDEMDEIQVACFDLDGRSLFQKIVLKKAPIDKWTNAWAIAPATVDNYWVLADVDANKQPIYFTKSYLKGGTNFLPAYYQTAPAKKYNGELEPTKAATQQAAKPGQVAKTGEVASVATGIGAILTLAGAALATTKRR